MWNTGTLKFSNKHFIPYLHHKGLYELRKWSGRI